jgi:hypothetical protein
MFYLELMANYAIQKVGAVGLPAYMLQIGLEHAPGVPEETILAIAEKVAKRNAPYRYSPQNTWPAPQADAGRA